MEPPGQPREFICEQCQGRFSSPEALQLHTNNCNGFTGEFEMFSDDRGQSSSDVQPDPFEIVYTDPLFDDVHQFDGYIDHGNYLKDIDNLANDPRTSDELDEYLVRGEVFRGNGDHAGGNEKHYNCSHCELGFITELKLRVHMQTHEGEEAYASGENGENASQPNAVVTSKGTQGPEKPYVCRTCGRGYSHSHYLYKHIRRMHTAEKRHECTTCGKRFSEKSQLTNHIRTHTKEKPYECKVCQKSFSEKGNLQRHVKTQHKEKKASVSGENGENASQPNAVAASKGTQVPGKQYVCSICGKTLRTRYGLHIHKEMHSGVKIYKCDICVKSFTQSSQLTEHLSTHECNWLFKCDTCFKSFKRKSDLEDHMKSHTGEKPYVCGICGRCFTGRNSLDRHMPIHTENKPVMKISDENGENVSQPNAVATSKGTQGPEKLCVCSICGRGYSHSHYLYKHIRRMHTAEKPHECTTCGKRFSEKSQLTAHIRTHTKGKPYECKVCRKSFSQKGDLQRHVKNKHPVETQHRCTVCDKSLTDNETLMSHMRTHDSQRPYECNVRGQRFSKSDQCVAHMQTHEQEHV